MPIKVSRIDVQVFVREGFLLVLRAGSYLCEFDSKFGKTQPTTRRNWTSFTSRSSSSGFGSLQDVRTT